MTFPRLQVKINLERSKGYSSPRDRSSTVGDIETRPTEDKNPRRQPPSVDGRCGRRDDPSRSRVTDSRRRVPTCEGDVRCSTDVSTTSLSDPSYRSHSLPVSPWSPGMDTKIPRQKTGGRATRPCRRHVRLTDQPTGVGRHVDGRSTRREQSPRYLFRADL